MISSVTVYCSSSSKVDRVYLDAAHALGQSIARAGWTLIYGGNYCGCMGTLADGARSAGGKVVGITPKGLTEKVQSDTRCDELIVTPGMRERKALLEQRGDAFVILPGGIVTLEEMFEILVGRSLGFHDKPIVLLNVNGFYDALLRLLRHGEETHFIRRGTMGLWHVASTPEETIVHLKSIAAQRSSGQPVSRALPSPLD